MIAVIDYGSSNLRSVCSALRVLRQTFFIAQSSEDLKNARKVILPGVGSAQNAMRELSKRGFAKMLPQWKMPFLGICLGMQLLSEFSEEGNVPCLKIISGSVKKFSSELKVPHVGWNSVQMIRKIPFTEDIPASKYFYFVHSYYFDLSEKNITGITDYGLSFASMVNFKNFYGVQFHPEKSSEIGLRLLHNFCEKC